MALDSYTDLVSELGEWLDDPSLSSSVDTFIRLAEARFNRVLRTTDMESAATIAVTTENGVLPESFLEMRALWVDGTPDDPLEQTSLVNLKSRYPLSGARLRAYAVADGQLWFAPIASSTQSLTAVYFRSLAGLSEANETNWLLDLHPDAYLLGCLVAAEMRGWNDARLPMLKSALDEIIDEINGASVKKRHGGSPLVATARPWQVPGVRI